MQDALNAFVRHGQVALKGSGNGPLAGLTFAAKDMYDIAGHRTGNGHPLWPQTHEPARRTASAVQKLLDAGAEMVGKTHTDELAYSLNGENIHYGTPLNPKAPGRIPGGSSSGSASATAGGLVDFALGTDCGGSVRLPASYCGVFGIRTSYGLIPADGIAALAHGFDTVGWFARDAAMMRRVGDVLLPPAAPFRPKRLLIATDAFAQVGEQVAAALRSSIETAKALFRDVQDVRVYTGAPADWAAIFRVLQGAEVWAEHRDWVERYNPTFGPGIRERMAWARTIDAKEVAAMQPKREAVAAHMGALLGEDALLCLPTAPGIAPKVNTPAEELEVFRARAFALLCIAGLARLPQINLPLATSEGCPLGLSLIAPRGRDRGLLDFVAQHF